MQKGNLLSRAFTLIELLVVIVIISILAAMLMTALTGVRKQSDQVQAMSNLKQVGAAFLTYSNDNNYTLPGRMSDAAAQATPKWPALLAGTDGTGTQNVTTNYVGDVRVYIAPEDVSINPNRPDLFAYLTMDNTNNTSWIMNGYNDLGALTNPAVQIRTVGFSAPTETILLGVQKPGAANFYMDFSNGDNTQVLNIAMYNGASPYLFADGSVRIISQTQYQQPAPQGTANYGDWLWLSDKNNAVPAAGP